MRKNLEGSGSGSGRRRRQTVKQASVNFHSNDYGASGSKQKGKKVMGDKNLENMKWHRTGKRLRKPDNALYMKSDNDDEEEEEEHSGRLMQCISKDIVNFDDEIPDTDIRNSVMANSPSNSSSPEPVLKRSKLDSVFLKSLTNQMGPRKQVKSKTAFEKKSRKEVISAICQFFYHAGIPANVADTPYFHKMLELVGQYGKGLQAPSSRVISGRFLQEEIFNIKEHLSEFKASWATPEVIRGLNECIVRLVADSGKRISASMQIPDFVSAKADFGTGLAVSTRTELDPGKNHDDSISFDSAMLESVLDDWLVESGKHSIRKDEEIPYDDMEQFYADEMDENGGKGPTEMVMFVKPLDVIPPQGGVTTDDDGLDFFDDDLTD
ncbi:hypothetical protein ACFE04_016373 [Oxalis oulophora]